MAIICASATLELSLRGSKCVTLACSRSSPSILCTNFSPDFTRDGKFALLQCEIMSRNGTKGNKNVVFGQIHGGSVRRHDVRKCRQSRRFSSREEIPSEVLENSKFVPITAEDPRFGSSAILLLGFTKEEGLKVQSLLQDMEGDFMKVLLCTEEMAKGTLGEAFDAIQPYLTEIQVAKGLPRICFLSGLTGEEIMMMIQIFPEAGLEPTVFAAHVPLNSDKSIQELMEEIMDDHRRLRHARDPLDEEP